METQCSKSCIDGVIALFSGDTACSAIAVAVVAFVLGMAVAWLLGKMLCKGCGCGAGRQAKRQQPAQKGEDRPFEKRKPHPAPADGSVEIYVGNLSYDMTEDQLRKEFEAYGKVNSARLITNRFNGKSKGFGFVQMPDRAEAERAIAALNDKDILGRRLKCNEAKNLI